MKDSNYIKIYTGSLVTTQRIISELDKVGISAVVKEQSETGLIADVFGGSRDFQEVFVHKDELEAATKAIKDLTSELEA
ncbi:MULTISPECIES: DUF2007 domain-containing protein [Aestuariibaculum]|uniref:DUF2007 domain-containing protein n=1 Tax=Aestuariibaculum lutulentum TaxID=2920935 RepID=A0ABS9RK81_9FLAO|nr:MULTISPECIES: DUF2007 domain-containing protein [Aestuariibaculum]MCH4553364.1 DUF2007 domain-containing protein [Aestuariibaculum lutulentum]MCR8667790.1 DUF2007 domain-containing protein [Aestuariibaculum sp. M13]